MLVHISGQDELFTVDKRPAGTGAKTKPTRFASQWEFLLYGHVRLQGNGMNRREASGGPHFLLSRLAKWGFLHLTLILTERAEDRADAAALSERSKCTPHQRTCSTRTLEQRGGGNGVQTIRIPSSGSGATVLGLPDLREPARQEG